MPRRKKPPPQRKLQQITDASGWTHVIKGPPGTRDLKITDLNPEYPTSKEATYTLETYLDRFRTHYTPSWKQSDCFKNLSRIFEQDILPSENIQITQCVCLGLGSMTAFGSENSSYELAALISMLEILEFTGKKHRIQEIVFQDPIFNSVDVAVLQSLGYTVVETPDAFSKLNSTTFLFAPHLECFNYATALEAATPVLSVGSDLERYAEGLLSSLAENTKKGSSQIFRDFMERTDSKPLPHFDRTSWCGSTCISWLKSVDHDSGVSVIEQGVRSIKMIEH